MVLSDILLGPLGSATASQPAAQLRHPILELNCWQVPLPIGKRTLLDGAAACTCMQHLQSVP